MPHRKFATLAPTEYANVMDRSQFMDMGMKPIWDNMPILAGPAYTVQLAAGDHLMLHVAIHQAPPGSVIVVDAVDCDYAVAGGNVCAIAQKRGILGFVIDGVIRDLGEIRALKFPVIARGIVPYPGAKNIYTPLNIDITCGGVSVASQDIIVGNEEGVAVIPQVEKDRIFNNAQSKFQQEQNQTLEQWQDNHREKVMKLLADKT